MYLFCLLLPCQSAPSMSSQCISVAQGVRLSSFSLSDHLRLKSWTCSPLCHPPANIVSLFCENFRVELTLRLLLPLGYLPSVGESMPCSDSLVTCEIESFLFACASSSLLICSESLLIEIVLFLEQIRFLRPGEESLWSKRGRKAHGQKACSRRFWFWEPAC